MWVILGIFSSFFLGFHEIFKKVALDRNAVLPVLFTASATGALFFIPFVVISVFAHGGPATFFLYIPPVSPEAHLFFLLKSSIVTCAWLFSYFSVKHLPVTVLAPINASGPVWTLLGAIIIYQERLNSMQWAGVSICIIFYFLLSFRNQAPEKGFNINKWLWFAFMGILFNSSSALLDKYLVLQFDRIAMQAWFSIYTSSLFFIILVIFWYPYRKKYTEFTWRWAAPLIGLFLIVADFLYFKALSVENSLVSILIVIRRASAILVFTAGALYFRETSLRKRTLLFAGIFTGLVLMVMGSD